MAVDSHPELAERVGPSLTEVERREELDLSGQRPAKDLFESERHDPRREAALGARPVARTIGDR